MVFPGVLRGLPGPRLATTPTNRPRRSLSSPGMFSCYPQCSAGLLERYLNEATRSRAAFEEPSSVDLAALRLGWRGLTPRWPRSSAARFRVCIQHTPASSRMQELSITLLAFSEKNVAQLVGRGRQHSSYPALSVPATMEDAMDEIPVVSASYPSHSTTTLNGVPLTPATAPAHAGDR